MKKNVEVPLCLLIAIILLGGCEGSGQTASPHRLNELSIEQKNIKIHNTNDAKKFSTANEKTKVIQVPFINQMSEPKLYNGCEVTSMAMILQYHGVKVSKNDLAKKVDYVPNTYPDGLRGNPNDGFVGDMVNGPGLGVYHGPMLKLAKQYVGERAIDITGKSVQEMDHYLNEGLPIWIITTTHLQPVNNFKTWNTKSGPIKVTYNVHSVAVTGVDKDNYYVHDPYGTEHRRVPKNDFIKAWEQMGSQAIVIKK